MGWNKAAVLKRAIPTAVLLLPSLLRIPTIPLPALAQSPRRSIVPANDGTGTQVTREGNRFTITGGQLSGDRTNLFHSFERLGLNADETANFIAIPNLRNIFGRVTGREASVINGLLQVTGGTANLYLINPAGIVFGPNARLDLPAAFTATTANGIGFGDRWFDSLGTNSYNLLLGDPNAFAFSPTNPGAILNAGNLSVSPGESILLLGGTVVNTGTLTAPGGQITIAAVPGENVVRLSQAGNLLSLEFASVGTVRESLTALPFTPLSLPALLTGGNLASATEVTVNPDGTVQLSGSSLPVEMTAGTAIASGSLNASGTAASEINVVGDRVALLNASLNASGPDGGGTIRIGGGYQGQGTIPNASRTVVDQNSIIRANARQSGNGGNVIVWADGTTAFYGSIVAQGGANTGDGGFVEVSGDRNLLFDGLVDTSAINGNLGTLLLDPENITIANVPSTGSVETSLPDILRNDFAGSDIAINATTLQNQAGNINLQASNDITIASGTALNFVPGGSITFTADFNRDGNGTFRMEPNSTITARGRNLTIEAANVSIAGRIDIQTETRNFGREGAQFLGNIVLVGDEIDLVGGRGSIRLSPDSLLPSLIGSEQAAIQQITGIVLSPRSPVPGTPGRAIAVGGLLDTGPQTLDMTETDLAALDPVEGSITIGGTGAGDLTVVSGSTLTFTNSRGLGLTTGGTLRVERPLTVDGAISFRGNEIDLVSGPGTIQTIYDGPSCCGVIFLLPSNPNNQDMVLGGTNVGGDNTLDLTTEDLAALQVPAAGPQFRIVGARNLTISAGTTINFPSNVLLQATGTLLVAGQLEATGNIVLQAREIDLNATVRTNPVTDSQGRIIFRPGIALSPFGVQGIIVGGIAGSDTDGILDLTATDLANVESGNDILAIGRSDNRSELQVGDITVTDTGLQGLNNDIRVVVFETNQNVLIDRAIDFRDRSIDNGITINANNVVLTQPVNLGTWGLRVTADGSVNLAGTVTTGQEAAIQSLVNITANNAIITNDILASGAPINLTSNSGSIRTGLVSSSSARRSGNITFLAEDGITATGLISSGSNGGTGGDISLTTRNGSINVNEVASRSIRFAGDNSNAGNAGTIALSAPNGNINATRLDTRSQVVERDGNAGNAGAVTVTSGGNIAFTVLNLLAIDARSLVTGSVGTTGNGGAITLNAAGDITMNSGANSASQVGVTSLARGTAGNGGNITFNAGGNIIFSGNVSEDINSDIGTGLGAGSQSVEGTAGNGGNITLNAGRNILVNASLNGRGGISGNSQVGSGTAGNAGAIAFNAGGEIDVDVLMLAQAIAGNGTTGNAGDVTFTARDNITTGEVAAVVIANGGSGAGGNIRFTSLGGNIDTGVLSANSQVGQSGAIALSAPQGTVSTRNLGSFGFTGGSLSITARTRITTGPINTSGTNGNGGDVFLDPIEDIEVSSIIAQGGPNGRGGTVDITTGQFFRATDGFRDRTGTLSSISTAGGQGGGAVTIRHGGGSRNTPFVVGDASLNGTAGAITSGDFAIAPLRSFPGRFTLGNLQLITDAPLAPVPPIPGTPPVPASPIPPTPPNPPPPPVPIPPPSPVLPVPAPAAPPDQPPPPQELPELPERDRPVLEADPGGVDGSKGNEVADRVGINRPQSLSLPEMRDRLRRIEEATGIKPALIYGIFTPTTVRTGTVSPEASKSEPDPLLLNEIWQVNSQGLSTHSMLLGQTQEQRAIAPQPDDQLELILVTAEGDVVHHTVAGATRARVLAIADTFRDEMTSGLQTHSYKASAQQLYQWLVAPLELDLQRQGINNLAFLLATGLRSIPLAALHDGQDFLIRRYSIGLMPSLNLTDTRYVNPNNLEVLAMGASEFPNSNQIPLPSAAVETATIAQTLWSGQSFLNNAFTRENLRSQRQQMPYGIIHLATHANFEPGAVSNSYIQLWDEQLRLDQIRDLGWNDPPVELVVLSACRTALGDEDAELGFAGFAVQAGVKSALASLWFVSDVGTLGFMVEFYQQLRTAPIKSEALRQAQLAMLDSKVRLENNQLQWSGGTLPLPLEVQAAVQREGNIDLSHPYYWSGFTMIGSPW